MRTNLDGKVFTVYLEGRLDTTNAEETEKELNAVCSGAEKEKVILDVENLQYISSAGLRVVLRLRKTEPSLEIINASPEVYDVFEMTGFTEMIPVKKAYRRLSVEGCDIIGKGAKGTVYRLNSDTIIKVYNNPDSLPDIHRERELARRAFVLGVPTAISYDVVKVGESYGSVFELLDAKSLTQVIMENPENLDEYIKVYNNMLKQIHETTVNKSDMPDIKNLIYAWVEAVKPFFGENTNAKIKALVDGAENTSNMLHCDYHTNNIMMQNGEALLIDMDTLSYGNPVFELANVYITYVGFGVIGSEIVEKFLGGMSYDTACAFWEKFLPMYFEGKDEAYIKSAEDKIKFLSYVRLLRHVSRRGINTDNDRRVVDICKKEIENYAETLDTVNL